MSVTAWFGRVLATLILLVSLGITAEAQYFGIGAGSTPEGDYLRGAGIAAMGMGIYNEKTAIANSINLDTMIRWDQYIAAVAKEMTREYASRRAYLSEQNKELEKKILDRLRENPEARDVMTGDALSTVMDQLTDPKISESSYRYAEVPLSVDVVRRIPFRLGESAQNFSMNRLTVKGKGKWPVAFQDKAFARELKEFERSVDKALDEAVEGKAQMSSINDIQRTVDQLARKLDQEIDPKEDHIAYAQASARLKDLRATVTLFENHKVQLAIGEIDKYSGTTVKDLKDFMRKFGLRFGKAESPDERELYPGLYETLRVQRDKVAVLEKSPGP
jgi:hypothetical protein